MTRRDSIAAAMALASPAMAQQNQKATKYVRFDNGGRLTWGRVDGDDVALLSAAPYLNGRPLGGKLKLANLKLVAPVEPKKVFAVGLNYKSHLGTRTAPKEPEIFYKPTTCLIASQEPIVIPPNAKNVHYEGELVLVLGRGGHDLNPVQARQAIFGVSCGNDVSERDWQNGPQKDLQWWRAKGSNTFGPVGPYLVHDVDYSKLLLQTRLNGEVVQKQSTSDLLFDCPTIVSYISKYVTLEVGDIIYTGTPGSTKRMNAGDTVEVEIENVGVLRNPVK